MIVPSWVYWVVIAALTAAVFGQQARVANAKRETSEVRAEFDRIDRERAEELAKYRQEKADLAAAHAAAQQETVDEYQKKLLVAQGRINQRDVLIGRLRADQANLTSVRRGPDETDASVLQRTEHRLQAVGSLLVQGAELAAEGASIVERRDAEVALLAGQIKVDRAACAPTKQ